MKDRNGWPLEIGSDVRTPGGIGRISMLDDLGEAVAVKMYVGESVVFTDVMGIYPPGDVELLGQSLKSKLNDERFTY